MEEIISLLEEELSCLREILSNLSLEETAITSGDMSRLVFLNQELEKLQKEEKSKRKKREIKIEQQGIPESALHELSLIDQARALQEKIAAQLLINQELKKRFSGVSLPPQKPKVETKKKTKPPQVLDKDPPSR